MSAIVRLVDRLSFELDPRIWAFAAERRAEIDAHFATRRRERPSLWNGDVLLLADHTLNGEALRGRYFKTDFASFLAWRDWNFPDPAIRNCYAQAALRGADGAFLLGVMAGHTANAGQIYFPSGTPDASDVIDGAVDLEASLWRELAEETGLTEKDLAPQPGWLAVFVGIRIALTKVLQARENAEALRARILRNIATQQSPELSDIRIVRGPDDLDSRIPASVTAALAHLWREETSCERLSP